LGSDISESEQEEESWATGRLSRPAIWRDALRIARDFPTFGTGLDTFSQVFPLYKSTKTNVTAEYAESDYLQLVAEAGLAGLAVVVAGLVLFLRAVVAGLRRERDSFRCGLILGGMVSCSGILFHGLMDFNLHNPANAMLFATVSGLTLNLAQAEGSVDKAEMIR
jgi:O-antigen ligase